jgi:hypothetical protein
VEARGRDPKGGNPRGGKGLERIGRWIPGNTGPACTDLPDAPILGAAARRFGGEMNSTRDRARREAWRLPAGETL